MIIIHGFHNYLIPLFLFSKMRNFIWLGWGFDYYERGKTNVWGLDLYLPLTKKIKYKIESKRKINFIEFIKGNIFNFLNSKFLFKFYFNKIKVFTPVLYKEHDFFIKWLSSGKKNEYMEWNYGCLEKHFINGFESRMITGDDILIGNSSSYTNNHVDTYHMISKIDINLSNRKIISPLSYGDREYGKIVKEKGMEFFHSSYLALDFFMPKDEYINTIVNCGYVIFNNIRQQGLGNIIIMLYLGAKVFLNQMSPLYEYFVEKGFVIFSIEDLMKNSDLIKCRLSKVDMEKNRFLLHEIWGEEFVNIKTKKIVEKACG
ncbi:TPA: TDP-N-acetylfucosamine:lipid II N-acetylfucosaminyltransferase [Photobacterium damselae]